MRMRNYQSFVTAAVYQTRTRVSKALTANDIILTQATIFDSNKKGSSFRTYSSKWVIIICLISSVLFPALHNQIQHSTRGTNTVVLASCKWNLHSIASIMWAKTNAGESNFSCTCKSCGTVLLLMVFLWFFCRSLYPSTRLQRPE